MANKFTLDTSRLPNQTEEAAKTSIDLTKLPDQAQSPGDLLPTQDRNRVSDDHLDFFSFGVEPDIVASQKEHITGLLQSDESAQQLKAAVKARMVDIQRRRQPTISRAPERTLWEEVDGYFRHIFGMKEADIAEANIALEARERGITVEEFKRQVVPEGEGLRRVERFISGAGAGAVATVEGMAGSVQWITDSELGADLANQAALWRNEMIPSAEERDFSDDVASGVGSMAVFFIPGYGVANGTRLLFGATARFAAWAGTGIMTSMEASTEAGMVYRDVLRETGSKTKAGDAATTTFWLNVPLITITNKLAFFTEGGSVLSRAVRGGTLEGTQEAGQEVISGMATGDTPRLGDLVRAFGVGAITGGGVGIISNLSQDKTDNQLTERDNEFIESFQASITGVTEEAEAIAVEEGKPVPQEQFEEIIATEATEEEVVNQLLGELGVTTEEIAEEGAPTELQTALTELQTARQEETTAQIEERAQKIEADAIASLTTLEAEQDPLPQLEALGTLVFDEGATDIDTFTERMKVKLGDLWEKFKGFIQTVFDKLSEERGAIEFGEPTPEQEITELRTQLQEQVKLARIARREGRQAAVESARRRINRIRSKEAQRRVKGRIEKATRRTLTELASETLPVALRGKFLKPIANSTTPKQFGDVAIRLQSAANAFAEAQELKKNLGSTRSKIAFIRKINEINQTVINDIKKELGISKPLRQMTAKELDSVTEKLKARVRFKRSRGFRPKIEERGSKRTDIPEALYEVNRNIQPSKLQAFKKKAKDLISAPEGITEKLLGVISTRLANVKESLRQTLRKFEFAIATQIQKDNRAVVPFIKKVQKLSRDDFADLDMALKNGDITKISELAETNDFVDEYAAVKVVLDDIYARANEVGFDVGYLENYFPRKVEDSSGFLEFMSDREDWSILDEAIKRKELSLGRALVEQEKVNLINNMIRGYSGGNITLSATGNMKDRIIDFVTPEMNTFYSDSNSALLDYIASVNEAIEGRKLFGKSRPTDSKADEFNNMEDSLGFYILDLINKGEITPAQEKEVRNILTARFSQRGTTGWIGIYKNLSYLTVMGSVFNAVTQIGDLSLAIYAGGLRDFLPATIRAIVGKSVITKEDIGIERIAAEVQEKSVMAGAVDTVFRLVGLTQIDRVGKEALINSVISKYQRQARQGNKELERDIKEIFGNSTEDVLDDLRTGLISEDVKYLAFNELLNFQPIVLSEVPEQYLRGGNGRIFYMLKTWQIKLFDIYRNEVYNQFKTDPTQATKNMIWLSILVMAMNGTADVLKDLLLGREVRLDDLLVDNAAKLIGFSRYTVNQVRREGLGSAIGQSILPPFALVDDVTRDTIDLYKSFAENKEMDKLRTLQNIPVIGKLYYYWFGRGSEIKKKQR